MSDVKLYMNLSYPETIEKHKNLPFDGIGLTRIEFIITSQIGEHPSSLVEKNEGEKYVRALVNGLEKVVREVSPKPVVVRFSDLKTHEYKKLEGGENYEPEEKNPMLGWRGASRYVSDKSNFDKVFKLECQVIKRLRKEWKNVWAMIPFVRTVSEARKVLKIMRNEGLENSKDFKIWLMAEVPSFAFQIEEFNNLPIDGYSIGSNDLCQFVLATGRDNSTLMDMGYFDERNSAVRRAMKSIIEGAKYGGKNCSICGESVSNYSGILKELIKSGIDSVSVNPSAVEKTRKIMKEGWEGNFGHEKEDKNAEKFN